MKNMTNPFEGYNDEKLSDHKEGYETVERMGETIPKEFGWIFDRHHRLSFNTCGDISTEIETIRLVKELCEFIERFLENKIVKNDKSLCDDIDRLMNGIWDFEYNHLYDQIVSE